MHNSKNKKQHDNWCLLSTKQYIMLLKAASVQSKNWRFQGTKATIFLIFQIHHITTDIQI